MNTHVRRACLAFALFLAASHSRYRTDRARDDRRRALADKETDKFCGRWNVSQAACVAASPCNASTARNLIIIHDPGNAGIGDRSYIVNSAASYAQALCATLVIPPPTFMLSEKHNNNNHVNCSWGWGRYWDMEPSRPFIKDWYEVLAQFPVCPRRNKYADLKELERYAKDTGHVTAANMAQAFDLYRAGTPFALFMNPNGPTNGLYNLVLPSSCGGGPGGVLRELRAIPGCQNGLGVSPLPVSVAADLVRGLETYLTIHIRRTDTLVYGCDTSPAKVRLYLNCQLGQFNGSFPAIVLFTDDTHEAFLSEVLSVLGEFALKVVHGDAAAKVRFKELGVDADTDNYLVYEVSLAFLRRR